MSNIVYLCIYQIGQDRRMSGVLEINNSVLPTRNTIFGGNESHHEHTETMETYVIVCELLNVVVLCFTVWIIICMVIYGRCTRKWNSRRSRKKNKIFIACFASVLLSLPNSVVVVALINLPASASQIQCSIISNINSVTSSVGFLGAYGFLWLRQRAIYSNHYMKALHGRWIHGLSWIFLVFVVLALVGVACVSLLEQTVTSSDHGCILQHSESENSTVPWEMMRVFEMWTAIISQIGFLSLFLYPMLRNRNVMKKISSAQKSGRDNVGRVIKRCTICAFIVIASDIGIEIWVQFIPLEYPVMIFATIGQVDLFVDVVCIFAMFEDCTKILIVPCRQKETISKYESTTGRNSSRNYSERSLEPLQSGSTRSTKTS